MAFLLEDVPAFARLVGAIVMIIWPEDPEKRELVNIITVVAAVWGIYRLNAKHKARAAARTAAAARTGGRRAIRSCDRYTPLGRQRRR